MQKVYKNRPNFLGSEVGLITKTITVPANASYVTENNRHIVKAGTIFTTPYYGLLYEDVDITDGKQLGSLMIAGQYIDAKLPATASSYVSYFAAQGLFPIVEGSITRPSFGTTGLSALTAPTPSALLGAISWSAVSNAMGYAVYDSNKVGIANLGSSTLSYTATATGTYYVQATGDNISYKSSDLASVTVSSLS